MFLHNNYIRSVIKNLHTKVGITLPSVAYLKIMKTYRLPMSFIFMLELWGIGFHSTFEKSAIQVDILPIMSKNGNIIQNHTALYHFIFLMRLCSIIRT